MNKYTYIQCKTVWLVGWLAAQPCALQRMKIPELTTLRRIACMYIPHVGQVHMNKKKKKRIYDICCCARSRNILGCVSSRCVQVAAQVHLYVDKMCLGCFALRKNKTYFAIWQVQVQEPIRDRSVQIKFVCVNNFFFFESNFPLQYLCSVSAVTDRTMAEHIWE